MPIEAVIVVDSRVPTNHNAGLRPSNALEDAFPDAYHELRWGQGAHHCKSGNLSCENGFRFAISKRNLARSYWSVF